MPGRTPAAAANGGGDAEADPAEEEEARLLREEGEALGKSAPPRPAPPTSTSCSHDSVQACAIDPKKPSLPLVRKRVCPQLAVSCIAGRLRCEVLVCLW